MSIRNVKISFICPCTVVVQQCVRTCIFDSRCISIGILQVVNRLILFYLFICFFSQDKHYIVIYEKMRGGHQSAVMTGNIAIPCPQQAHFIIVNIILQSIPLEYITNKMMYREHVRHHIIQRKNADLKILNLVRVIFYNTVFDDCRRVYKQLIKKGFLAEQNREFEIAK